MDRIVNDIQLTWILRTYRTCNATMRLSKYKFYNKLLGGVNCLELHQMCLNPTNIGLNIKNI